MVYISWIHFIKRPFIHFAFCKYFTKEILNASSQGSMMNYKICCSLQQNVSKMMLQHDGLLIYLIESLENKVKIVILGISLP